MWNALFYVGGFMPANQLVTFQISMSDDQARDFAEFVKLTEKPTQLLDKDEQKKYKALREYFGVFFAFGAVRKS